MLLQCVDTVDVLHAVVMCRRVIEAQCVIPYIFRICTVYDGAESMWHNVMQVCEEHELKAIRSHREIYEQKRNAAIAVTQRLEAAEVRVHCFRSQHKDCMPCVACC